MKSKTKEINKKIIALVILVLACLIWLFPITEEILYFLEGSLGLFDIPMGKNRSINSTIFFIEWILVLFAYVFTVLSFFVDVKNETNKLLRSMFIRILSLISLQFVALSFIYISTFFTGWSGEGALYKIVSLVAFIIWPLILFGFLTWLDIKDINKSQNSKADIWLYLFFLLSISLVSLTFSGAVNLSLSF